MGTERNDAESFDEEVLDEAELDDDAARLEAHNAEVRESLVSRAHRKHGMAGAILAGGMLAIDQVLGRKPKEQPAAVSENCRLHAAAALGLQPHNGPGVCRSRVAPSLRRPGNKRIVRRRRGAR